MIDLTRPLNFTAPEFVNNKYQWYERIREEKPVHRARISVMSIYTVARYEDCEAILKDPRALRNRSTVTGGARFPFPVPKSIKPIVSSMIQEDDPNHRRLRDLVRKAFRPQAIARLEERIDRYSQELLDGLATRPTFDLQADYAMPIPIRLITDMMGIGDDAVPRFRDTIDILSKGFSGVRVLRTLFRELPATVKFVRQMIHDKANHPGDDILTGLIQAEDNGDRLTEDELVAMVFLLVIGGFETTMHLITNGVHTLLEHRSQWERLRAEPALIDTAVEEIVRYRGPLHATKPFYATEDITLHRVTIPKAKPIMPLLAAANHDPRAFDNPQEFDIARTPNRHLGFGHGIHYCLGAHLARAETRFAIQNLITRFPDLQLAVNPDDLVLQPFPGWHRYNGLPVSTRSRRAAA